MFPANRADVTTLQEIVETMNIATRRIGIWVWTGHWSLPRNRVPPAKRAGLHRGHAKRCSSNSSGNCCRDWQAIREAWSAIMFCPGRPGNFVLCRSRDRREKEKAMHERFISGSMRDWDGSSRMPEARLKPRCTHAWDGVGQKQPRRGIVPDRGADATTAGRPGVEEGRAMRDGPR